MTSSTLRRSGFLFAAALLAAFSSIAAAQSPMPKSAPVGKVDRWVIEATAEGRTAEFLVLLSTQADLAGAAALSTKEEKGRYVFDTLTAAAEATQGPLLALLQERGVPHRRYYIVNMIWVRGSRDLVSELAGRDDVWRIEGNPVVRGLLDETAVPLAEAASPLAVEAAITYTNAPSVWALGFSGQGIVVGGQDTGYAWNHPALIAQYRGWNGTSASHDYNWHDSIHSGGGACGANALAPCDDNNHGTHTMGTVLGDDGAGNQIGMAPGAQWIGSRNMDQGNGTPATYIESFEFFLAPYPVGGLPAQGNPALAPDLTTNSWACPPSEGCSTSSLTLAVQAQRAAGIMTVVAAGNSGSACSSVSDPPAIYAECTTVGALNNGTDNVASFSSRGPVTVDGSGRRKPDIMAPGTGIRSSVTGGGYQGGWSGTSMATPHVAGAVALLWSAHPALRGNIPVTETVLQDSAVHRNSTSCSSSAWPNNVYGYGRLNVLSAVNSVYAMTVGTAQASGAGAPGGVANYSLTVTNQSYLPDSYAFAFSGGTGTATPSTLGPIAPGASANVTISINVPAGATVGTNFGVTVTATSVAWAAATGQVGLTTTVSPVVPVLVLSQSTPGAGVVVQSQNLVAGHEYFNVFSGDLCPGGPGTGPYLGLCANDVNALLQQLLLPVGTVPFHFLASGATESFGPFALPAGLTVEGLCLDLSGGALLGYSTAIRYVVN